MTQVSVTAQESTVSEVVVSEASNRIAIEERPVAISVAQQNNAISLSQIANQAVVINAPASNTVAIQQPADINVVVQTSDISESKILDLARTDAGDTSFNYTSGKLSSVVRDGYRKDFTYNEDGTVNTLTITTNFGTVVKTFGYNQNGLTSITVT